MPFRNPKDVTTPDSVYQPIVADLSRFSQVPLAQMSGILRVDLPTVSCQIMYELQRFSLDTLYVMLAAEGTRRFGNGARLYLQELYVVAVDKRTRQPNFRSVLPFRSLRMSIGVKDDIPSRNVFPVVVGKNLTLVDSANWQFNREQVRNFLK